jgi:hypothetical protein
MKSWSIVLGIAVCFGILFSLFYFHYGWLRRPKNARAALVGQYHLQSREGRDCSEHGIERSTLELRVDGASEQRDRFKDGSQFVTPSTWDYYEYNKWCPAISCDLVAFQKLRVTTNLEVDETASPIGAGLIVTWSRPPKIGPLNDCFFAKVP